MSRDNLKPVLDHKGRTISLNVKTGKFDVNMPGGEDLQSLEAAKKAIDRAMKMLLEVERRPVITHGENYRWDDEDGKDTWIFGGELTSFSAHHWDRNNLHANVVVRKERSEHDPDQVYEDTPTNRECVKRITEIGKQVAALSEERGRLLNKVMTRVPVPNLKPKEESAS